jgi:hypothetical protein
MFDHLEDCTDTPGIQILLINESVVILRKEFFHILAGKRQQFFEFKRGQKRGQIIKAAIWRPS